MLRLPTRLVVVVTALALSAAAQPAAAVVAVWDGGDGMWTDAKWNGGLAAIDVFGIEKGIEYDEFGAANDFVIGGGAEVVYLAGPSGVDADFRLNSSAGVGGPTSGTVQEGATLDLRTESAPDGLWTHWDGDLTLDGGRLVRSFDADAGSLTSGAHMWGSWDTGSNPNLEINVTLLNGGHISNHGQMMFGAWNEHGAGLKVNVTINDGSIDLTGGTTFVLNDAADQDADLHFYYGTESNGVAKAESYVINFTGPGSIVTDHGVRVHSIGADYSSWEYPAKTYEELWDMGILQADGQSGATGATFGEFFSVSGAWGEEDYTLTSKIGAAAPGDFNGDGAVDGADLLLWQREFGGSLDGAALADWEGNFGAPAAAVAATGVPEPTAATLLLVAAGAALPRRRKC